MAFRYLSIILLSFHFLQTPAFAQTKNEAKEMQLNLNKLGFDAGAVDGAIGKRSREALRLFQVRYGLEPNRKWSPNTAKILAREADIIDLKARIKKLPINTPAVAARDALSLYPVCQLSRKTTSADKDYRNQCGYVDQDGHWAISPKFYSAGEFINGFASVLIKKKGLIKRYLIEQNGDAVPGTTTSGYIKQSPDGRYHASCAENCTVFETTTMKQLKTVSSSYIEFQLPSVFTSSATHADGKKRLQVFHTDKGKTFGWEEDAYASTIPGSDRLFAYSYTSKKLKLIDPATGETLWDGTASSGPVGVCDNLVGIRPPTGDTYLLNTKTLEKITLAKGQVNVRGYYSPKSKIAPCNGKVLLGYSTATLLTDIATGKEITRGYYVTASLISGNLVYFKQAKKDGKYTLIDETGKEIFSQNGGYIDMISDNHLRAVGPGPFLNIYKFSDGKFSIIAKNLIGNSAELVGKNAKNGPRFLIKYGNSSYGFTHGEYLIDLDGNFASAGGNVEVQTFDEACQRVVGEISIELLPMFQTCDSYLSVQLNTSTNSVNPEAYYTHAYLYGYLFGDKQEFLENLTKAAELGSPRAQADLSFKYFEGDNALNIKRNQSLGAYWAQRAANNGHGNSQFNIGVAYMNGRGVGKDLSKAYYWFKRAADKGHEDAIFNVKIFDENHQAQKQRSQQLTLGDLFRSFSAYTPSNAELSNQRSVNQCRASQRQCVARCASIPPPANMQLFGKSPRQICVSDCQAGTC